MSPIEDAPACLKLDKIDITYFRCFESLSVPLQADVNVIVGVNGAGKTAILDAIAIALWHLVAANGGGGPRQRTVQGVSLRPSDLHIRPDAPDAISGRSDHVLIKAVAKDFYGVTGYPARTESGGPRDLEWEEDILFRLPNDFAYGTKQSIGLADVYGYVKALWQEIRISDPKALIPLPVVAYYRANRRLSEMPNLGDIFSVSLERDRAFLGALNAGVDYQAMCQWFYRRENHELREKLQVRNDRDYQFPDLKAVRAAVATTLEDVERVFFDDTTLKVSFRNPKGTPKDLELAQLSDGYRNLLALVLDFARRLAQAHPHWEKPLDAPGILLIDEIELHLHPQWQQQVITNLRKAFPNTQIIVTTHSPQVLTTVHRRNIKVLRDGRLFQAPADPYGAESKRALEDVLHTDSRPPERDNENVRQLGELFRLINANDLGKANQVFQALAQAMGTDEPALIEAETIIRNREWEKELGL